MEATIYSQTRTFKMFILATKHNLTANKRKAGIYVHYLFILLYRLRLTIYKALVFYFAVLLMKLLSHFQ